MKSLFLRMLPYLISIVVGILIYIGNVLFISNADLNGLISNIVAGLLSIPLVFLSYEIINEVCTRKLNTLLFNHLCEECNGILVDVIGDLRILLGQTETLEKSDFEALLKMSPREIKQHLVVDERSIQALWEQKEKLEKLLHTNANLTLLPRHEITTLLMIYKEIGIISKEISHQNKGTNTTTLVNAIEKLCQGLSDWIEFCDADSLLNHHNFLFIE